MNTVKVIPLGKHSFNRMVKLDRYVSERKIWDLRMAKSLKTDKSTWKECSHCHESFPETNDFWVKNGKKRDGSQRYRTQCGDKRNEQKLGGNGCYNLLHPKRNGIGTNKSKRDHNERMLTWRGQLIERRAGCITSDINKIARKKKNAIKNGIDPNTILTDFEKSLDVTGEEFVKNGLKATEVHPLTINVLEEVLEEQKYKCNELGLDFVLEYPNLDNLSIDSLPNCEYHRPEEIQLVLQWYNRAMNKASREERDKWYKKYFLKRKNDLTIS